MTKLQNFQQAFSTNTGSCTATCQCGKVFYDYYGSWDWDEGELEKLQKDPKAVPLDYAVGSFEVEGKIYVLDCDCWKQRVEKVMGFIDSHARKIAEYLRLEKKRKQEIADNSPVVEEEE